MRIALSGRAMVSCPYTRRKCMDKVIGSMEALNAMQLTADMEGLDAQSKALLRSKEVLAVILQGTVSEYQGYSRQEIMGFIEEDSMADGKEVSPGRTNTRIQGDAAEFVQMNEKTSRFDLAFRAKNPQQSTEDMLVSLHVDVESQKSYRPGYPVEKRGMYYLARSLSSQLSLVTETTDYGQLEKCYSIWICRDDIPKEAQYSISFYEVANTKNIGISTVEKETYDLMTLAIIKLGTREYNGKKDDEGFDLLNFLNAVMYPHKEDFIETISDYIDFSENEELWKEAPHMTGLGLSIYEEGFGDGEEKGIEKGIEALVQSSLSEGISRERIIANLRKFFGLTEEKSETYYERFASWKSSVDQS